MNRKNDVCKIADRYIEDELCKDRGISSPSCIIREFAKYADVNLSKKVKCDMFDKFVKYQRENWKGKISVREFGEQPIIKNYVDVDKDYRKTAYFLILRQKDLEWVPITEGQCWNMKLYKIEKENVSNLITLIEQFKSFDEFKYPRRSEVLTGMKIVRCGKYFGVYFEDIK